MSQFNSPRAVALKYDGNEPAPIIVASGLGHMAEKIVELANENNVPVYEDNSLATVLSQLELGENVPENLYQAVVDIYVYFLKYVPKDENEPKQTELRAADLEEFVNEE